MKRNKTGKHHCVIKDLKRWLKLAKKQPEVSKIILGVSENSRHKFTPGDVIFKQYIDNGLYFTGYTGNGIRKVYILCEDKYKEYLKEKLSTKEFKSCS